MIRIAVAALMVLALQGCVSLTPEQEKLYGRAITDEKCPKLEVERLSPNEAAALSVFVPGLGHLYAGEPALAVLWFPVGLMAPVAAPVAAWHDAHEINRMRLAEAYRSYLEGARKDERERPKFSPDCAIVVPCETCGASVRVDARFCPGCGRRR